MGLMMQDRRGYPAGSEAAVELFIFGDRTRYQGKIGCCQNAQVTSGDAADQLNQPVTFVPAKNDHTSP